MPRFSDKANAIQDVEELFQTELIHEWLFDSSNTDLENSGDRDMKQAVITDLEDIALIRDVLSINWYLSKRVLLVKDIAYAGILFDDVNP